MTIGTRTEAAPTRSSEHGTRVRTAAVALPVLLLVLVGLGLSYARLPIWIASLMSVTVVTAVAAVLSREIMWLGSVGTGQDRTRGAFVFVLAAVPAVCFGFYYFVAGGGVAWGTAAQTDAWMLLVFGIYPAIPAATFILLAKASDRFRTSLVARNVLFGLYAATCLSVLPLLFSGGAWLTLVFAVILMLVFASDTAAYYVGRRFGRRKLLPSISPKKTWAGLFGGMAAPAIFLVLIVSVFVLIGVGNTACEGTDPCSPESFSLTFPIIFGAAALMGASVGLLGTAGDLFASWFKRMSNAKDSGNLLPGHGGLLDRVDSLLPVLVASNVVIVAFGYLSVDGISITP